MNVELLPDERVDDLQYKNLKLIQKNDGFRFGMDSVIMANFVDIPRKNAIIFDIGTGTGVISILLAAKHSNVKKIYGIEIQNEIAEMAERSVIMNELSDKIEIINDDIKGFSNGDLRNMCDIVVTNPPYKKMNTGLINENEKKLVSRHECKCTLEDIIFEASKLLKNNGIFYMVHRPERLSDIFVSMRKNNIEPKEMKLVYPHIDANANLILIKGVKCGKAFLNVLEPLIVYDEKNKYTQELLKYYSKGE